MSNDVHPLTRFALAGASNMTAASVTNPIDVIKVRMQLEGELATHHSTTLRQYPGFLRGGLFIVRREGVRGLYRGLFASLLREGSYSTIRLGAYEPVKELLGGSDPTQTPLWKKLVAGACTGAIGSAIANPTDLVKIRLQAQRPDPTRQRYRSTANAFRSVVRDEGWRGLWRGCGPTVQRAALLTATQIPSYDHSKHFLLNWNLMQEGLPLHITCSMFAGFATATVTSPVDVIKTRVMNQQIEAGKPALYSSTLDAARKIFRHEGVRGFYKGWFPNWMRIGPHTIVTFLIFEQLRKLVGIRPV